MSKEDARNGFGITSLKGLVEAVEALQLRVSRLENTVGDMLKEKAKTATPSNKAAFVMPYGKHKGLSFDEIEADDPQYLEWLAANVTNERILEALELWQA